MTTYLPEELQERLHAARRAGLRKKSRLRVQAGGASYPVLRLWRNGFAVEDETTPPLRGLVELLEGARPIYQCLVIAAEAEDGEMRYEFKRSTAVSDHAPADFCRAEEAPAGLLTRG